MTASAPPHRRPALAHGLRRALASDLLERGVIDQAWYLTFAAVKRDELLEWFDDTHPLSIQQHDLRDRDHSRAYAALAAVYTDQQLIVRHRRGRDLSSTQPSLAARMLSAVVSGAGDRRGRIGTAPAAHEPAAEPLVVELGTGTGYLTALLEEHLGAGAVCTVEIDADAAASARSTLTALGYRPRVVVGNALAYTPDSPVRGLLCGFTVDHIPARWLQAVRPGGTVVVPMGRCVLHLTVDAADAAAGRVIAVTEPWWVSEEAGDTQITAQEVFARCRDSGQPRSFQAAAVDHPGFRALMSLVMPTLREVPAPTTVHDRQRAFIDTASGAMLYLGGYEHGTLAWESGEQHLADRIEQVARLWRHLDGPDPMRLGLTVAADGAHQVWLDTPDHAITSDETVEAGRR